MGMIEELAEFILIGIPTVAQLFNFILKCAFYGRCFSQIFMEVYRSHIVGISITPYSFRMLGIELASPCFPPVPIAVGLTARRDRCEPLHQLAGLRRGAVPGCVGTMGCPVRL